MGLGWLRYLHLCRCCASPDLRSIDEQNLETHSVIRSMSIMRRMNTRQAISEAILRTILLTILLVLLAGLTACSPSEQTLPTSTRTDIPPTSTSEPTATSSPTATPLTCLTQP